MSRYKNVCYVDLKIYNQLSNKIKTLMYSNKLLNKKYSNSIRTNNYN